MEATPKQGTDMELQSLDAFFTSSVHAHPERIALHVGGTLWTYQKLDRYCRDIERTLSIGVLTAPAARIGVIYGRSAFSYAAVIATMRCRAVYVPLNPKWPSERLLRVIEDADIETVVVDAIDELSEGVSGTLARAKSLRVVVDGCHESAVLRAVLEQTPQHAIWRVSGTERNGAKPPSGFPDGNLTTAKARLAYIIYTSGSTGVPKGVAITQESAYRCIQKSHQLFLTNEHDRFTQFSALSFDVSILDLFLCWRSGAALVVPEASEALVPLNFAMKQQITVWSSVPSLANVLRKLRLLREGGLASIRLSLFCGEALPRDLAKDWANAAVNSRIVNLYGPTECTIFATYANYEPQREVGGATVPIGAPLPGIECRIMDQGQIVVEDELSGELWLSGDQLAEGYWNNPAVTQAAFMELVAEDGSRVRWYRTGDLVSRANGSGLVYRGRIDRQVKLLGHRIELQEVEGALRETIGCALVAVLPIWGAGGLCEKLIAYCDRLSADEVTIKARCLERIPRYMVPDRIVELEAFPFSNHGKVDYQALAARALMPPQAAVPTTIQ